MSTEFGISNVDTACVEVLLLDTGEITARVFTGPESLAARRVPRGCTRRDVFSYEEAAADVGRHYDGHLGHCVRTAVELAITRDVAPRHWPLQWCVDSVVKEIRYHLSDGCDLEPGAAIFYSPDDDRIDYGDIGVPPAPGYVQVLEGPCSSRTSMPGLRTRIARCVAASREGDTVNKYM